VRRRAGVGNAGQLPLPWVAVRFLVAREFHCLPWDPLLDDVPIDRFLQTVRLMNYLPRETHEH
jgi:hypothetical protein